MTNIGQIFPADKSNCILYTLLDVNKIVKTRRDVIKYLSGGIGRQKKTQSMSSREKRLLDRLPDAKDLGSHLRQQISKKL